MKKLFFFCLLPIQLFSQVNERPEFYDLSKPQRTIQLPQVLQEISALTDVARNIVSCVQDEKGIIYEVELTSGKLLNQIQVLPDGDYEGLTFHDSIYYILRSDGMLFYYNLRTHSVDSVASGSPSGNNEGLGWDLNTKKLLIACKTQPGTTKAGKDQRVIYAFDVVKQKLGDEPLLDFNLSGIHAKALEEGIKSDQKTPKGKPKKMQFRPSSVAVHPVSGEYYVLSASDRMLAVFDKTGSIRRLFPLPEKEFPKPEGITFMPDLTMVISNEGLNGRPNLILFSYLGK